MAAYTHNRRVTSLVALGKVDERMYSEALDVLGEYGCEIVVGSRSRSSGVAYPTSVQECL